MPSIAVAASLKAQSVLGSFLFVARSVNAVVTAGAVLRPDLDVRTPVQANFQASSSITANLTRHISFAASLGGDSSFRAVRAPEDYQASAVLAGSSSMLVTLLRHSVLVSGITADSAISTEVKTSVAIASVLTGQASMPISIANMHYSAFSNVRAKSALRAELTSHYGVNAVVNGKSELGGHMHMFTISQGMLVEPEERSPLRNMPTPGRRLRIKPSG